MTDLHDAAAEALFAGGAVSPTSQNIEGAAAVISRYATEAMDGLAQVMSMTRNAMIREAVERAVAEVETRQMTPEEITEAKARIVAEAVAEERAKCILTVCWMCASGWPLTATGDYHERPGDAYTPHCKAALIRRRNTEPNPAPTPEKEKAD